MPFASTVSNGLVVAATLAFISPLFAQSIEQALPPAATQGGLVAGQTLASGVKAWLGVPFAKPPTQELRWQPPQPMSWKGVWNADRLMPECIQVLRPHNINHYFAEEPTSENCLYMNIWAPASASENGKRPVIVFIYGGGDTIGSSGMPHYGGIEIAKRGAVFVNFNYRVGLLGFMAHPELSKEQGGHSGNYAYLDQVAALKWIHDNIAKFGGDPDHVVIAGQSAGARAVALHILSPLSKGLFSGAMMSSGCNWTAPIGSLADAEKLGLQAQERLGAASLDDMRQMPADRILTIQGENQLGVNIQGLRQAAVIDGHFLPKSLADIIAARETNDVPFIAHFNKDEGRNALMNAKTVADYQSVARKMFGDKADAFLKLYPVVSDGEIRAVGAAVEREGRLERNARACALLQTQSGKAKPYISMYARKHPYTPGVKIADQNTATIGAYHTADIPYWFGTQDAFNSLRKTRDWTAWDRELAEKMMASLIAFARTGNPETAGVTWPAWTPTNEQKIVFGDTIGLTKVNSAGIEFMLANPPKPVAVAAPPRVGPRD